MIEFLQFLLTVILVLGPIIILGAGIGILWHFIQRKFKGIITLPVIIFLTIMSIYFVLRWINFVERII